MQQPKNLLLFIVLSMIVVFGWSALQNHFWPPPKKKKLPTPSEEQALSLPDYRMVGAVPGLTQGWVEQLPASPGMANACQLVAQLALAEWSGKVSRMWPPPKVEPVVQGPAEKIETFTLGNDDGFNLKVVLTTRGGGVEAVTLNNFKEANKLGLPTGQPLELIPKPKDDADASFLLYHYADAKGTNPPVDTLGRLNWKLAGKPTVENPGEDNETHKLAFEWSDAGVKITKIYSLRKGDYHIGLDLKFERLGDTDRPDPFRYQLAGGHGLPIEGEWYTYTYRNSLIGLIDAKGNVERDLQDARSIGIQEGGNDVSRKDGKYIGYAGIVTQYFASMIVVDNKQPDNGDPNFLAWVRPTVEDSAADIIHLRDKERTPYLIDITTRVVSQPLDLRAGKPITHRYLLYHGPVKVRLLGQLEGSKQVATELVQRYEDTLHLDTLTDYHSPGPFGSFFSAIGWTRVLVFCTNMMHGLLHLLHQIVSNYGLCIMMLTVIVRGAIFPISRKQAMAAARMQEKMRELAPEVKKLEEKHRNDPMGLQQAKNELYMKRGINPLAMMGSCWMIFLQMPIFMGLYYALNESIMLRLAPFLWIENLAAPDMLWNWGPNIPLVSTWLGPFLNILPIIAVTLMLVQQKMMMPPATNEQEAMQQSMTKWMMVVMGFMFYKLPSGLCIYFIVSSLWGVGERKILPQKKTDTAAGPTEPPPGRKGSTPKSRPDKDKDKDKENGNGAFKKVRDWWAEVLEQAAKNPRKTQRGKRER